MTGGAGDWGFSLPNGYSVVHVDNYSICICKGDNTGGRTIIGRYIVSFCYDQRYVGVQQIPIDENIRNLETVSQIIEESNPADYQYYLIDTQADELYGPFDGEEYKTVVDDIGVYSPCQWINTSSITSDGSWENYINE